MAHRQGPIPQVVPQRPGDAAIQAGRCGRCAREPWQSGGAHLDGDCHPGDSQDDQVGLEHLFYLLAPGAR
jgi:hypothetical protein